MRRPVLTATLALIAMTTAQAQFDSTQFDSTQSDPSQDRPATEPAPAVTQPPKIGDPIADLVLPTVDGARTIALSEFKGQKVLLIVFASW